MLPVATVAARVAGTRALVSMCAVLAWSTLAWTDDVERTQTPLKLNYCRFLHGACVSNCSHARTLEGTTPGSLCDQQLVCCVLPEQILEGRRAEHLNGYGVTIQNSPNATESTERGSRASTNNDVVSSSSSPAVKGVTSSTAPVTTSPAHRSPTPATYKYRGMIIPSVYMYLQQLRSVTEPPTASRHTAKYNAPKYKFIQINDSNTGTGSTTDYETTPTTLQDPSERDYKCGVSPSVRDKRIVGGTQARRCAYPWMVYIVRDPNKDDLCGGTLVSSRHIITAAHCFDFLGANWPKLILGEYTHGENSTHDSLVTYDYRIATHPSYDRMTYHHDIAVLTLSSPVHFKDCLHPICLPRPGQVLAVGSSCTVAGWGSTSRTTDSPAVSSPYLMQAEVKVVQGIYCHKKYQNMFDQRIHVCAGDLSGGSDSCVGDSGGPLMCRPDDVARSTDTSRDGSPLYLMGVISAGANPCAQRDTPAVYTDVSKTWDWLKTVLGLYLN
ncbi:unnamed protein product [Lymnaea stagnalis]|uniref:Peptidase S1 domain-containing protein n=1 Tax=Lymnaea stagnalis TaxID=6523 RepID=A0AAV2IT37_LYMST